MLVKSIFLTAGLLASLGLTSPVPEATVEINTADTDNTTSTLTERATGVWLNVYGAGSCASGWRPEPKSGWVWGGQCKNIDPFTYGARAGDSAEGWDSRCTFKFWEQADCKGKATVHHVSDYRDGEGYRCMATANKRDGTFYLNNGAASVLMTC
ncbi:hypothetical protein BJY04DRAFT_230731 [Aspergillus karnatakaensis]|uniref:uncharacterized protein n=1 Tax=Aspergillus karnatakaensis TaxID=1810916 RepID=UPI003CCCF7D3